MEGNWLSVKGGDYRNRPDLRGRAGRGNSEGEGSGFQFFVIAQDAAVVSEFGDEGGGGGIEDQANAPCRV